MSAAAKIRIWLVFAATLAATFSVVAAVPDTELARLFVGTWKPASKYEGPNADRLAITYFADGKFKLVLYADDCRNLKHEATGTWQIKDGQLYTQTTNLAGSKARLRPGRVMKDRVVSINGNTMILINMTGQSLHRSRGMPWPSNH